MGMGVGGSGRRLSSGTSKLEDVLLGGTSPFSLRQLSARFGMILPFLFAVSFSIAIFYFREEFHELLMPGVSRFATVANVDGSLAEPTPEAEGALYVATPPASEGEPTPESEVGVHFGTPPAASEGDPPPLAGSGGTSSGSPSVEGEPEPTAESEAASAEGEPESEPEAEAVAEVESELEAEAAEVGEPEPEPESEAAAEGEPEAAVAGGSSTGSYGGAQQRSASGGPAEVGSDGGASGAPQQQSSSGEQQQVVERKAVPIATPPPILPKLRKSGASAAAASGGGSQNSDEGDEEGDSSASAPEAEPAYYEVNDAMSAFIGNAGLIFGLIYAFIFGRSYTRFDSIMDTFYAEVSAIHKLVLLVQTVSLDSEAMQAMLDHLTHYTNQCRYEMTSGIMVYENEQVEVMTQLYAIVPALQRVVRNNQEEDTRAYAELNGAIAETMLETIGTLCDLRYQRWSLSRKAIPLVLWVFITLSAMLMFFGVMMMQSGWYNVDFTLCMLTVGGIGLMIYCLADVDQTHTGLMRIPVDRLDDLDFVGSSSRSINTNGSIRLATAFRLPRVKTAFFKTAGGSSLSPTSGAADVLNISPSSGSVSWANGGGVVSSGPAGRRRRRSSSTLYAAVQKFSMPPAAAAPEQDTERLINSIRVVECEVIDACDEEDHHSVIDIEPSSNTSSNCGSRRKCEDMGGHARIPGRPSQS